MQKTVTIFGGSGFLGRYIVGQLAKEGYLIRVACRNAAQAQYLKTSGYVGQVTLVNMNVNNPSSVDRIVEGADIVINAVGILYPEGRGQNFDAIHHLAPEVIARAVAKHKVTKYIHISSIGADSHSPSLYAKTKGLGEEKVKEIVPQAIILRPSIVFGPEDGFFNKFASMASMFRMVPLIGGGKTMFQPVYVCDIAHLISHILRRGEYDSAIFELGGPTQYSFRELMDLMLEVIGHQAIRISLPFWLAGLEALFLERLPKPLLTRDQLKLLKLDNIVNDDLDGFKHMHMKPTALEVILPIYLNRFRSSSYGKYV